MEKRIMFISDLHLRDKVEGVYSDKKLDIAGIERNRLKLLKDALCYRYMDRKLDLLVFMGDYVFGGDDEEIKEHKYKEFTKFLHSLAENDIFRTDDATRHIIIIPGNHDIERNSKGLERFCQTFEYYMHPFQFKKTKSEYRYGLPILFFEDIKLIIACVSTVENSATLDENVQFVIDQLTKRDDLPNKDELITKLKTGLYKDVPSIQEKLRADFSNACNKIEQDKLESDYSRIVISHNPLVTFEDGITVKEYNGTVGGYDFLRIANEFGFTCFVHGHHHAFTYLHIEDLANNGTHSFVQIGVPSYNWGDHPCSSAYTPQIVELEVSNNDRNKVRHMHISLAKRMFEEINFYSPEFEKKSSYSKILVDFEIEKIIQQAQIIKNGDSSRIEAASYDCALGYNYKIAKEGTSFSWEDNYSSLKETSEGPAQIELKPNSTVLIYTLEEFDVPDNMVFHASPMSSWTRKGLRVDLSYFVDPGFNGAFCFPVTNVSNQILHISSREPIMSIELVELDKKVQSNWVNRHPNKANDRNKKNDI